MFSISLTSASAPLLKPLSLGAHYWKLAFNRGHNSFLGFWFSQRERAVVIILCSHCQSPTIISPNNSTLKLPLKKKKKSSILYLVSAPLSINTHTSHWPSSMVKPPALRSVQPSPPGGNTCWCQFPGWVAIPHTFPWLPKLKLENSFFDLPLASHWHSHPLTFNHASFLNCQVSV